MVPRLQANGRILEGNYHGIFMQQSCNSQCMRVCIFIYIYRERERYAAIDIGHVGDRISRTVESSSRG